MSSLLAELEEILPPNYKGSINDRKSSLGDESIIRIRDQVEGQIFLINAILGGRLFGIPNIHEVMHLVTDIFAAENQKLDSLRDNVLTQLIIDLNKFYILLPPKATHDYVLI